MYGIQPKQARQQRPRAHALRCVSLVLFFARSRAGEDLLCGVTRLELRACHSPLAARRTIGRRGRAVQVHERRGGLVDGPALLLGWHSRVLRRNAFVLGARREMPLLLLRWRRGITLLGRRRTGVRLPRGLPRGLLVHLALLELRLDVGVLVVCGRLLLRDVGRLGVLVHGNYFVVSWVQL
jgi:hypothetical protein